MTLKEFMEKNGYSIRGIALFLEIDYTSIAKYVTGTRMPNLKNAKKIKEKTRGAIDYDDWFRKPKGKS